MQLLVLPPIADDHERVYFRDAAPKAARAGHGLCQVYLETVPTPS
jgi:hypothetical protein